MDSKSSKNNTVSIKTLVFEGKGLGHTEEGKVVFIPKTLPDEVVEYREISRKRGVVQGWPELIQKKSEKRITPKCKYFDVCGGCSFQHMEYEEQLKWKEKFVEESLERIGGFSKEVINTWKSPIKGAKNHFEYRNKTEFSFAEKDGTLFVGFHDPQKRFCLLKHEACFLHSPNAQKGFEAIQEILKTSDFDVYNLYDKKKGFLYSITFRTNHNDSVLVVLNTNDAEFPREIIPSWVSVFQKHLGKAYEGFVQVQKERSQTASESAIVVLDGTGFLIDTGGGLEFEVGATSFFQVNREMASELVSVLKAQVQKLEWKGHILDLCCGNGFLGMSLSSEVDNVTGIELNPYAVEEGDRNKKRNGIQNYTFYQGDARKELIKLLDQGEVFDGVIVDPPRGGLGRKTAKVVAKIQSNSILYVSCNPTTLARDLEYFRIFGYEVQFLQPLDLFPQTYHVESVVRLQKKTPYAEAKAAWIAQGNEWK